VPRNGSGTYSLPASSWNPATTGTTIESTAANTTLTDLASALTQSLSKDGQTTPTGNLPMGGFKLTGLADGGSSADSMAYGQGAKLAGGNTFTGAQVINGAVSLSGDLSVTGTVIFTSGTISVGNLTVTSVASIASLNVTGTTNANILNVTSTLSVAGISNVNVLNVASVASIAVLNVASTAAIAVLSVGSALRLGTASGSVGSGYINAKGYLVDGTPLSGGLTQVITAINGALVTSATIIPFDDTIPLNTEGVEVLSATITPQSAAHKLVINVTLYGSSTSDPDNITGALFQDAVASAISAGTLIYSESSRTTGLAFNHAMTAGTTSATTFRVRIGCGTGSLTFNGAASARRLGGVMGSSLIISEVT
jgi:hypothetical protein